MNINENLDAIIFSSQAMYAEEKKLVNNLIEFAKLLFVGENKNNRLIITNPYDDYINGLWVEECDGEPYVMLRNKDLDVFVLSNENLSVGEVLNLADSITNGYYRFER